MLVCTGGRREGRAEEEGGSTEEEGGSAEEEGASTGRKEGALRRKEGALGGRRERCGGRRERWRKEGALRRKEGAQNQYSRPTNSPSCGFTTAAFNLLEVNAAVANWYTETMSKCTAAKCP